MLPLLFSYSFSPKGARKAEGLVGKQFEDFLELTLGGRGSFKAGGREFDGAIGDIWYEAKSGNYWNLIMGDNKKLNKFKDSMGDRLRIARDSGASYELHSNTLIPDEIKKWLNKKGIPFKEWD